jgi:3',5'-cyclic AMP phosphodiesterase CpdA
VHPFLVIQLSDPHIGATWSDADPARSLAAAVEAVNRFPARPAAVIVSGDITDTGAAGDCELARELLAALEAPAIVLPGNHDDRAELRRCFELPGEGAEPIQYAADLGELRVLVLDSVRPGSEAGRLDAERLAWLEAELAAEPRRPALIATHHPPLATAVPVWDEIGLPADDRDALARTIESHPQVLGIVAGHLHRIVLGDLARRPVLAIPSSYEQAKLDFAMPDFEMSADPAAFAVHTLVGGRLVSHVQPI